MRKRGQAEKRILLLKKKRGREDTAALATEKRIANKLLKLYWNYSLQGTSTANYSSSALHYTASSASTHTTSKQNCYCYSSSAPHCTANSVSKHTTSKQAKFRKIQEKTKLLQQVHALHYTNPLQAYNQRGNKFIQVSWTKFTACTIQYRNSLHCTSLDQMISPQSKGNLKP